MAQYTDRFRKVVFLAREESDRLGKDYIGSEHLLVGIFLEEEGSGAAVLTSLGLDLDAIRQAVEVITSSPASRTLSSESEKPFSPRAKQILEGAEVEANLQGHRYVSTEHLLLALMRTREGVATRALSELGVTVEAVEHQIFELLGIQPRGYEKYPVMGESREFLHTRCSLSMVFDSDLDRGLVVELLTRLADVYRLLSEGDELIIRESKIPSNVLEPV